MAAVGFVIISKAFAGEKLVLYFQSQGKEKLSNVGV